MKLREKSIIDICDENNLPYTLLTNVVEEANTKAKIKATLEIMSKTLCGTLGPYGSTTIIQDRERKHLATKDGYDLINRLTFNDEVSRTVLDMVTSIAANQVHTVGDGSTSAIVVANALYSSLTNTESTQFFNKVAPKDIVDILGYLSDYLEQKLKSRAHPVSEDLKELETIAMISTNNDKEAGKLIYDIYKEVGRFGFITTEVFEKKEKDSYEVKEGIELYRGYIDKYFARSYDGGKVVHDEEPRFFLTNSMLSYNDLEILMSGVLGEVCGREQAELVIVAENYSEDVKTFLKANRMKHLEIGSGTPEMVFTAVDMDQVTNASKNTLKDLATLLGCEVYDKFEHSPTDFIVKPGRFIGRAQKAIITSKRTQIIGLEVPTAEHKKMKDKKVKDLNLKLTELLKIEEPSMEEDMELYEVRRRISLLTNSTAVINVAGKTLSERMTRERLFDDAIFASKSALEYGYITGANMSIPRLLSLFEEDIVAKLSEKYSYFPVEDIKEFFKDFIIVIKESFLESYRNVLNNSYFTGDQIENVIDRCIVSDELYNLKMHKYEKLEDTSIINSVDTDIQIMRSCFSIIGIMATSNQFITLNLSAADQVRKK